MKTIIYTGTETQSPAIETGPASYLALPRGVPCAVDDSHAELLLAADPAIAVAEPEPMPRAQTKKGATP